jgi:hypothetical protein
MHYQRARAASKPKQLCACGCGELTPSTFVSGYHTRLFSAEEQSRRGRMNDGSTQRDRGSSDWYRKFRGRHEHRFVVECLLGRELSSNEIVHHKNGNKKDNRPCNLQVMSRSEHINEHRTEMNLARLASAKS